MPDEKCCLPVCFHACLPARLCLFLSTVSVYIASILCFISARPGLLLLSRVGAVQILACVRSRVHPIQVPSTVRRVPSRFAICFALPSFRPIQVASRRWPPRPVLAFGNGIWTGRNRHFGHFRWLGGPSYGVQCEPLLAINSPLTDHFFGKQP